MQGLMLKEHRINARGGVHLLCSLFTNFRFLDRTSQLTYFFCNHLSQSPGTKRVGNITEAHRYVDTGRKKRSVVIIVRD